VWLTSNAAAVCIVLVSLNIHSYAASGSNLVHLHHHSAGDVVNIYLFVLLKRTIAAFDKLLSEYPRL
jgi:hypothetical protein